MSTNQGSFKVFAIVVDDSGKPIGNKGTLEFPHIPHIGEHVLIANDREPDADPNGQDPDLHRYEIVDVVYLFHEKEGESRGLAGWEIVIRDQGPRYGYRYPSAG